MNLDVKSGEVLAVIVDDLCPLKRLSDRRVVVRVTHEAIMDDRGGCWRKSDGYGWIDPRGSGPSYHAVPWVADHERRWAIKQTREKYMAMLRELDCWLGDRGDGPEAVIAAAGEQIIAAHEAAKAAVGGVQ